MKTSKPVLFVFFLLLSTTSILAFQSDELLIDDDEFEGGRSSQLPPPPPPSVGVDSTVLPPTPKLKPKFFDPDTGSDSRVQFVLEHAFGDSGFEPAGTFNARLKSSVHGGQTLTKLRFSRNDFSETEKENFKKLVESDDFYRIRVPSSVLSPPGREYIVSSVKARCLPKDGLDEQFIIHLEGVNILGVNYGSHGACAYPRQKKLPSKWTFNSRTVLKTSEQAPRTPTFAEEILSAEVGQDEGVKPLEKSFWAKYWMYLIPLGLIVMNAVTQAMNMPEEQAGGQGAAQTQQPIAAAPRGQSAAVRRR